MCRYLMPEMVAALTMDKMTEHAAELKREALLESETDEGDPPTMLSGLSALETDRRR
jgi:hypothetical protein